MAGKRRSKDGLTDKQRAAIPIIARARSKHHGIVECEKKGIASQRQYYQVWIKEPKFLRKLDEERDKYFSEIRDRVRDIFKDHAEILAQRLVAFGLQDGKDRLRAIEIVLQAIGVDLGKGSRLAVQTNVNQHQSEDNFFMRLRDAQREREQRTLEARRSRELESELEEE
jgi:hypothetical protein